MNYEQKYNEIVQRARELHESGNALTRMQMEIVCPELRESEDERIRKALICGLSEGLSDHNWQDFGGATIDECIAWLEKQKESLHISERCKENADSFIDEDERIRKAILDYIKANYRWANKEELEQRRRFIAYLEKKKESRQKFAEWSEEDELMRTAVIQTLERFGGRGTTEMQIAWLKSLRPSWKPSEDKERMKNDKHFLSICQHLETLISESKNDEAKESIDKDYKWLCEFYQKSRCGIV